MKVEIKKSDCGCTIQRDRYAILSLKYCPKHNAAPEMYEALKAILPGDDDPLAKLPLSGRWDVSGESLEKGRLAIAKADGK